MKKLGDIDIGELYNAVYLFSKIIYILRDIGKIIFLSWVTPLSPTLSYYKTYTIKTEIKFRFDWHIYTY